MRIFNYSKSKAEKMMKIATEYGDENSPYAKTYMCTDLSISKALRLLQVPENDVESFAEKNDIQDMTVKELEEKIKALKQEKKYQSIKRWKRKSWGCRNRWNRKMMKRNVWPGNWRR